MGEGVRVINTLCKKIITLDFVSGDNFPLCVLIYPNTFIQGQYVYIATCFHRNLSDPSFCKLVHIEKSEQRNFTHLIRCQTMKVKPYIILNTSRKHVNYEEDKNKVSMNKSYNIQNTIICNGIFHISLFKALSINESETTRGERE